MSFVEVFRYTVIGVGILGLTGCIILGERKTTDLCASDRVLSGSSDNTKSLCDEAAKGNTSSQFNLANQYKNNKEYEKAHYWYSQAALKEHASSQYMLGEMHNDPGLEYYDQRKAYIWFKKASNKNHSKALYELGLMYYIGEVVYKNYKVAYEYFTEACFLGHANSCYNKGVMHELGLGKTRSMHIAAAWYADAVRLGSDEAKYKLDYIIDELQPIKIKSKYKTECGLVRTFDCEVTKFNRAYYLFDSPGKKGEFLLLIPEYESVVSIPESLLAPDSM